MYATIVVFLLPIGEPGMEETEVMPVRSNLGTGYFELLRKSPFPIAVSAHIVFRLIRIGLAGVLLTSSSSGLAHE